MIRGIDVSHWQGDRGKINWDKVRNAGYEFAFVKATEGTTFLDPRYKEQVGGARSAGLLVGHYHFAGAGDAVKEAEFFISQLASLQEGEIVILDWEVSSSDAVAWCKKWLDRVAERLGQKPLLYINESTCNGNDWTSVVKGDYGLWIAKYGNNDTVADESETPNIGDWPFYTVWQFSSKGIVPGITGNVDLNQAAVSSIETLKKYGKQKTQETTEQKSKVTDELRGALKMAHNLDIGEYISEKDQKTMAEKLVELKQSEMSAREKLESIRSIIK